MLLAGVLAGWLLSVILSRRWLGSMLNPMTVFATAWLASAALFQSALVRWFVPGPGEQALLVVGVTMTLAGGYVATCGSKRAVGSFPRRPLPGWVLAGIAVVAFGGFAALLWAFSREVSLLVYWVAPERVEALGFQRRGVGYLNLLHIVLPAMLVLQGHRSGRRRPLWYGAALLSLATTPFAGIKAYFVQSVLTLVFATLYESRRVAVRTQVLAASVAVLLVFSYFVFYDEFFRERYVDYVGEGVVDLPQELEPLARPLAYATGSIAAFAPFVRFQDETYFGRATVRGVSRLVGAFEPVHLPPFNADHYSVPVPFNTVSVFREYYEDGREAGVVILAFLAGLSLQILFLGMRARPSLPRVTLVSYVTSAQALSPFVGFLSAPQALYFLLLLGALDVLTSSHGRFRCRLFDPEAPGGD